MYSRSIIWIPYVVYHKCFSKCPIFAEHPGMGKYRSLYKTELGEYTEREDIL